MEKFKPHLVSVFGSDSLGVEASSSSFDGTYIKACHWQCM